MEKSKKSRIILSNTGSDCLHILNSGNGDILQTIYMSANSGPHGITVCQNRQFLYFANSYSGNISVMEADSGQLLDSIGAGATPCHIAEEGDRLYVSNFDSDSITIIDKQEKMGIACVPAGRMPHDILCCQNRIAVAESGSDSIGILEGNTGEYIGRIPLRCAPVHVTKLGEEGSIAAACTAYGMEVKGYICVVEPDAQLLLERIRIGNCLTDIAADPDGIHVYVTDGGKGCVYKVNLKSGLVVENLYLSGFPASITLDQTASRLYVTDTLKDVIYVIKKGRMRLEHILPAGRETSHVVYL